MKYIVTGSIIKGDNQSFNLEVDAKSEKHAKELALIRLGSKGALSKFQITISKVAKKA